MKDVKTNHLLAIIVILVGIIFWQNYSHKKAAVIDNLPIQSEKISSNVSCLSDNTQGVNCTGCVLGGSNRVCLAKIPEGQIIGEFVEGGQKIANKEKLGVLCYGKVYRKDEIDSRHMNIFHQFGALYLQPDSEGVMPLDALKNVLSEIVEGLFGKDTNYKFLDDTFPYTDPSLQIEVEIGGRWIEIMGGGMPKKSVLKKMNLEGYNGWAFGFGLERLSIISMDLPDIRLFWSEDERVKKQLKLGQKFQQVSKYPPVIRDISFIVSKMFVPNDYFDLIRETVGEDKLEEVGLIDEYENDDKFGSDKKSYAYRVTYRSLDRTLTSEEVDKLHKKLETNTKQTYDATIR